MNIEEKIKEIKETKSTINDYLTDFDKILEEHTAKRLKETPMLINLFNEFIGNIYKPSNLYRQALKIKNDINEEMNLTFSKEQKKLLEQWQYCDDRMINDMIEQAFIYGYAMCSQLSNEAIKQYPLNNNE